MKRQKFACVGRFGRDERGTVLVPFILYLVAIMGMIGLAFDGARTILLHNGLQDLADAAALAAAQIMEYYHLDAIGNAPVDAGARGPFDHHDDRERQVAGGGSGTDAFGEPTCRGGSIAPPSGRT